MSKCKTALGATRVRSDNPLAPFNDIFPPPKKFQQIPPKSHATHIPSFGKVHQDVRFASCALSAGNSVKQNRLRNRKASGTPDISSIPAEYLFANPLCFRTFIQKSLSTIQQTLLLDLHPLFQDALLQFFQTSRIHFPEFLAFIAIKRNSGSGFQSPFICFPVHLIWFQLRE